MTWRVLLIADYVREQPWTESAWVPRIARALVERGHRVTVACDGVDETAVLEGIELRVCRPRRSHRAANPLPFARWAAGIIETTPHDLSVSCTRLVAGDILMALDRPGWRSLRAGLARLAPAPAAMALLDHRWLIQEYAAERRAARASTARGTQVLDAAAVLGRAAAPTQERCGGGAALRISDGAARARVRAALGVTDACRVVALLTTVKAGRGTRAMLEGLAHARRDGQDVMMLAAGRHPASLEAAARRSGTADGLRAVGMEVDIGMLLAAADAAAAPEPAGDWASGRWVREARARGAVVIAHPRASGAAEHGTSAGWVSARSVQEWASAFRALDGKPVANGPKARPELGAVLEEAWGAALGAGRARVSRR